MIKTILKIATLAALSLALSGSGASAAPLAGKVQPSISLQQQRQAILRIQSRRGYSPRGMTSRSSNIWIISAPTAARPHGPLKQLLAADRKVRIIYRDWPIFGPASQRAAGVSIASQWQGKHTAFHDALMTTTQPLNEAKIRAAAKKSGIDWPHLEADLKRHSADIEALLKRNADQAEQLGLEGTPGFIIGNVQSFGGMRLGTSSSRQQSASRSNTLAARGPATTARLVNVNNGLLPALLIAAGAVLGAPSTAHATRMLKFLCLARPTSRGPGRPSSSASASFRPPAGTATGATRATAASHR